MHRLSRIIARNASRNDYSLISFLGYFQTYTVFSRFILSKFESSYFCSDLKSQSLNNLE